MTAVLAQSAGGESAAARFRLQPIPTAYDPLDDPLTVATPTCCCSCCCCCLISIGTTTAFLATESAGVCKQAGPGRLLRVMVGICAPFLTPIAIAYLLVNAYEVIPQFLRPILAAGQIVVTLYLVYSLFVWIGFGRREAIVVPILGWVIVAVVIPIDLQSGLNDQLGLQALAPVGMMVGWGLARLHRRFRRPADNGVGPPS